MNVQVINDPFKFTVKVEIQTFWLGTKHKNENFLFKCSLEVRNRWRKRSEKIH